MAPIGYFVSPALLNLVNAAPDVKAEALPFLRIMFVFSIGMMIFFMLSTALRSAGDARTPMFLGIAMTVLNLALNILLIRGLGPIPPFGTKGRGDGNVHRLRTRRHLFTRKTLDWRVGDLDSARRRVRSRLVHYQVRSSSLVCPPACRELR